METVTFGGGTQLAWNWLLSRSGCYFLFFFSGLNLGWM